MPGTTAKYQIPYIEGSDLAETIDETDQAKAERIDEIIATASQGTFASRPTSTSGTPGIQGRLYYATDREQLYYDHGTGWDAVGAKDDQGLLAARPASTPGKEGREYWATDAGVLFRDTGTGWVAVSEWPGTLKQTARATAPDGYLLCDGAAISRSTYAALFAAIGTAYGPGNGSTTFNLPDLRGRVPVGLGTGSDVDTLGENDGLAVGSRSPRHNHTNSTTAASGDVIGVNSGSQFLVSQGGHTHAQGATGLSGPSFLAVNHIIKT